LFYENQNLCIPTLEWIGLKLDDLELFYMKNKECYLMKLTQHDVRMAKNLIEKFKLLNEYNLINQVNQNFLI
jgi:hypothetical protein